MQTKRRDPVAHVELVFDPDADHLDDLRGEISTCVVVDDTLFLAYDESSAIERLRWKDGKWRKHQTYELADFFDLPEGADGEMDIEGLAWETPYLWFTGSMSLKRDTPEPDEDPVEGAERLTTISIDQNRFSLGRIPCKFNAKKGKWAPKKELERDGRTLTARLLEGGSNSTVLTELLSTDPHLQHFMDIPCKDNGFDIEGLAVHGERIFLGLRGPVIGGWAIVLEFSVHERNGFLHLDGRGERDKPYRKHFLNLAGMGIREVNVADESGDLFLLAGPTMDLDGTISTWRVPGGLPETPVSITHDPERVYDVVYGGQLTYGKDKAEGMALLDDGTHLITYDSPVSDRLVGESSVIVDVFRGV